MNAVDDPDLDALWAAGSVERRRRADRRDERATLQELATGRVEALSSLLERHGAALWRFAAASVLDAAEATALSTAVWRGVVDEAAALSVLDRPFRWELLRRASAAVGPDPGRSAPVDRAPSRRADPFGGLDDPARVAVAFCRLPAAQRGPLWLAEVERIPAREVGRLLGTASIASAETLQAAAVALFAGIVDEQLATTSGRCASTVERFHAYLDGTLVDRDVEVLHRHLAACAACSRRLDAIEDPYGVLLARLAPAPADLATATAAALRDDVARHR